MKKILLILSAILISYCSFGQVNSGDVITIKGGGGGGSTDTTSLSNRINSKLAIADTANMLLPYATKQKVQADSTTLAGAIPAQFNPIAGTNVTLSGTYPNITFNSSGSGSGTNLSSRSTSSFNDTTSNSSRPVIMSMNYGITPNSSIINYTDFHAFDFNFNNASTNSTAKTSMYQQENTIRFSADSMGLAVPFFSHVQNLDTGYIGSIKNIRINNDMSGSTGGGVGSTFGVYIENGLKGATGYINNQYGIYIDSLTSGAVNNFGYFVGKTANGSGSNYGFYSLSSNNFMKGLTVGNLYSAPTVSIPDTLNSQFLFNNGTNNTVFKNNYGGIINIGGSYYGGLTVGQASTQGSSVFINTPSVSQSNSSGLGITGSFNSAKSTIRISAYAPNLATYTSDLAFMVSNSGVLTEAGRFNSDGSLLVGDSTRRQEAIFNASSSSKGSYPIPRLTLTSKTSIVGLNTTNKGLMAYDLTYNEPSYWNGYSWVQNGAIYGGVQGDANLNTVAFNYYELGVITANRTITMPTGYVGKRLFFWNENTSSSTWLLSGVGVVDAGGNNVTSLANGTTYYMIYSVALSKYIVISTGVAVGTYLKQTDSLSASHIKGVIDTSHLAKTTINLKYPLVAPTSDSITISQSYLDSVAPKIQTVTTYTASQAITTSQTGSVLVMNSSSAQTFTLPTGTSGNIGIKYTIVKKGTGTVTITAASGNYIMDSSSGGSDFNSTSNETWATQQIQLIDSTHWVVIGGSGTWQTN